MLRTHTCGELDINNIGEEVQLSGWVQKNRDLGSMCFIDLRDRYGVTQLAFNTNLDDKLFQEAKKINREFVIQITGIGRCL